MRTILMRDLISIKKCVKDLSLFLGPVRCRPPRLRGAGRLAMPRPEQSIQRSRRAGHPWGKPIGARPLDAPLHQPMLGQHLQGRIHRGQSHRPARADQFTMEFAGRQRATGRRAHQPNHHLETAGKRPDPGRLKHLDGLSIDRIDRLPMAPLLHWHACPFFVCRIS